jgi:hypothetical protein
VRLDAKIVQSGSSWSTSSFGIGATAADNRVEQGIAFGGKAAYRQCETVKGTAETS